MVWFGLGDVGVLLQFVGPLVLIVLVLKLQSGSLVSSNQK